MPCRAEPRGGGKSRREERRVTKCNAAELRELKFGKLAVASIAIACYGAGYTVAIRVASVLNKNTRSISSPTSWPSSCVQLFSYCV